MKLVFLGPPGAGKGTQAKLLAKSKGLAHISTGDMLREAVAAGTEVGRKAQDIMNSGQLVPDDIILKLISERTAKPDCKAGFILDGFPRNVAQAEALQMMLQKEGGNGKNLDQVLYFEISEGELMKRLENRRQSEGRIDDDSETQRRRISIYEEQTAPLIDYYRSQGVLKKINSLGSVEEIQDRVVKAIQ